MGGPFFASIHCGLPDCVAVPEIVADASKSLQSAEVALCGLVRRSGPREADLVALATARRALAIDVAASLIFQCDPPVAFARRTCLFADHVHHLPAMAPAEICGAG